MFQRMTSARFDGTYITPFLSVIVTVISWTTITSYFECHNTHSGNFKVMKLCQERKNEEEWIVHYDTIVSLSNLDLNR